MYCTKPARFGDAAAATLLELIGFSAVRRDDAEVVVAATPSAVDGYILTRQADKYGRCVALLFTGELFDDDAAAEDLAPVFLTAQQARVSLNVRMLAAGLAYPTYYTKLYAEIRTTMTEAVHTARASGAGLWPSDTTTAGFTVTDQSTLTEDVVVLPKLFRRLVDYLALNDGDTSLAGLPAFLTAQDDRLIILSEGRFIGLDNIVETDGQQVRLRYPPEDLVFAET